MILESQSVSKNFFQGSINIEVLKDLSFSVNKGETLAIIGPSGSGKSTLLSLLAGLDTPNSGAIVVNDKNISQMSQAEVTSFRGQHIGIIFQQFHLMPNLTALENVSLPLDIAGEPNAKQRALKALEQVGLSQRAHHTPSQLSGGECQRVAIARAFVVEPEILLADEPSGNLDSNTGDQVMDLLFDMVKANQMTMILVTHNNSLADKCDRQLQLERKF